MVYIPEKGTADLTGEKSRRIGGGTTLLLLKPQDRGNNFLFHQALIIIKLLVLYHVSVQIIIKSRIITSTIISTLIYTTMSLSR